MKTIEEILYTFCADREQKNEVFYTPFEQNGYIYATDGNILIKISKSITTNKYQYRDKPNCQSVFVPCKQKMVIKISELRNKISKADLIDEVIQIGKDVECKECDGYGEVEWEYKTHTKYFDCPVCDGSGYKEQKQEKQTGNKIHDPYFKVNIIDRHFQLRYIDKVINIAEFIGDGNITLKYNANKISEQIIFIINENIDILLMPTL